MEPPCQRHSHLTERSVPAGITGQTWEGGKGRSDLSPSLHLLSVRRGILCSCTRGKSLPLTMGSLKKASRKEPVIKVARAGPATSAVLALAILPSVYWQLCATPSSLGLCPTSLHPSLHSHAHFSWAQPSSYLCTNPFPNKAPLKALRESWSGESFHHNSSPSIPFHFTLCLFGPLML